MGNESGCNGRANGSATERQRGAGVGALGRRDRGTSSADELALREMPILVVDDEQANALLLRRILEHEGFRRLTVITDPQRAPVICAGRSPQLILLDLHMSEFDGFEIMRLLASPGASGAGVPIVVLTAEVHVETRRRALAMGARDFIVKPFDRLEVVLRVRNILQARRLQLGLQERVLERTRELEHAQLEVLDRLALAAEYRDDETQEHAYRIGRTSALLARELGLSEGAQALIARAAPLHDIGKIGVPDSILRKPGGLAAEEFETVQGHAEIGARMLSGSAVPVVRLAERIALSHHERWDGMGYPRGLSRTQIPLTGRIVAVADVFDALATERPYKRAWPLGRAAAEVGEQAGRQLDPSVVAAFGALDHPSLLSRIGPGGLPHRSLPIEAVQEAVHVQ